MRLITEELSIEQQLEIYQDIIMGSEPKLPFYILVILSTIIAGYGLVSNSTAIVIGAMIVAPLMMPIIGIALSVVVSDSLLFRHASAAEIFGVLLCIGLGFLVGKLTFGLELGSEILARTQPSPYDILVALAAGLAGAYTLTNPRLNSASAGIAIAVSLVPPLTVCGICLAMERYTLASGAFLLFFANFLAIELAGIVVFLLGGFTNIADIVDATKISPKPMGWRLVYSIIKHFFLSVILLITLTIYLTSTLVKTIEERQFQRTLEATLREEVQKRTGARLSELNYVREASGKINVIGVVMTPQEFLPTDVEKLQTNVRAVMGDNLDIVIRSMISKDADSHGTIFLLDEEKLKRQQQSEEETFLRNINDILKSQLALILGAYLDEVRHEHNDDGKTVIASVRTPVAITPTQTAAIQAALQTVDANIRLIIRSIITRDADATRYLYQSTEQEITKPLEAEAMQVRQQLEKGLKQAVSKVVKGGSLLDFQYNESEERIQVLAVIQTPQNFSSRQVRTLQNHLQDTSDKKITLVVRSVVGIDMDENGFVVLEEPTLPAVETPLPTP